jgi:AAA15 family ATPase/GTPase
MSDTFITHIKIGKVRDIVDLEIPLSKAERQHLIVTGRNGCGKTSLLLALNDCFTIMFGQWVPIVEQHSDPNNIPQEYLFSYDNSEITFNRRPKMIGNSKSGAFMVAFFSAKRGVAETIIPSGIQQVNLKENYAPRERVNKSFI